MDPNELPDDLRCMDFRYNGKTVVVDGDQLETSGFLVSGAKQPKLADECRFIKRPILANAIGDKVTKPERSNLIMVASALPGEGKTFTCINLALSIAREKDWSVVLVDADCARQHVSNLFAAESEKGLLDLIRNPELDPNDLIMPSNIQSLSILPSGRRDELAVELLASDTMSNLAARWAEEDPRRLFVFDSSPLLLTPEPAVLSAQVGQVVLVVHAGHTSHVDIQTAASKLEPGVAVNAILNQVEYGDSSDKGGYYDYYGRSQVVNDED